MKYIYGKRNFNTARTNMKVGFEQGKTFNLISITNNYRLLFSLKKEFFVFYVNIPGLFVV